MFIFANRWKIGYVRVNHNVSSHQMIGMNWKKEWNGGWLLRTDTDWKRFCFGGVLLPCSDHKNTADNWMLLSLYQAFSPAS